MKLYRFEIWYRTNSFQKDFTEAETYANSKEEATELVSKIRRSIFKVELLSINGEKVKLCPDV